MSAVSNLVEMLPAEELGKWPDELSASAGFVSQRPWTKLVDEIYRFPTYYLAARTHEGISGVLVLCHIRHPILGNYLATAPFASYGGFAFSSLEARDALLQEARRLALQLGVDHANVRFDGGDQKPPPGWVQHPIYATYQVELQREPEALMASYSPDHRNHVRKSLKKGSSIRFGRLDLLDETYEVLARSMHELGSPYHSKRYLQTMAETLGKNVEFAVVRDAGQHLVGAGVFVIQGDMVTNLHANILRCSRADYAGEFLYWSAILRYRDLGLRLFDLGRSLIGSGNETFKSKWKPRKQLLAYWYALNKSDSIPELNQKSAKFQTAIWVWKRLPSFIVRPIGPFLVKGLA